VEIPSLSNVPWEEWRGEEGARTKISHGVAMMSLYYLPKLEQYFILRYAYTDADWPSI